MTDQTKEQLSACLDGELTPAEMETFLKRLEQDAALRATADRYANISAVIRDQQGPMPSPGFAARIAQAIDQEPLPTNVTSLPLRRRSRVSGDGWLRPAISAAMAAGIATFAVLIIQRPDPTEIIPLAADTPAAVQPPATFSAPASAAAVNAANWSPERLANYVVAHSEYSSPLGRTMVLNGVLAADPDPMAVQPPASAEDQAQ